MKIESIMMININKTMIRHKCDLLITVRLNYLISVYGLQKISFLCSCVCGLCVDRSSKSRERETSIDGASSKMIHHIRELLLFLKWSKKFQRMRNTFLYHSSSSSSCFCVCTTQAWSLISLHLSSSWKGF